jgi:hypothetical protein
MSEHEKKGSPWPWFLVPIAAVSLFFVLRECRQQLPAAEQAPSPEAAVPATPAVPSPADPSPPEPAPAGSEAAPAAAPAPQ